MAERMSNEQVLQLPEEPIMNDRHINDWTSFVKGDGVKFTQLMNRTLKSGSFNYYAAETTPKSIRYRQLTDSGIIPTTAGDCEYKRGDYLLVDQSAGKVVVPFKLFQLLFL